MRRAARDAGAVLLGTLLLVGGAGAEVRSVEAVGAVALDPVAPSKVPPRDAALQRALRDAVLRVALEMVAELPGGEPAEVEPLLGDALGHEPLEFTTRFRILEDRGAGPALFIEDPGVESEYVVVVEAHIDTARVRERLEEAGLLGPPTGSERRIRLRVEIVDVDSYAVYAAVRTLLDEVGARSALPLEMEWGRAVLDVEASQEGDQLLTALVRAAPPNLQIVPLGSSGGTVRLRAFFLEGGAAGAAQRGSAN